MRTLFQRISPVLVLLLVFACSSSTPPPSEETLIKIFTEHETAIVSLLENPDNNTRKDGLGVKSVNFLQADPKVVHLTFWPKHRFGSGGASKGLAFLEKEPQKLVNHIDNNPDLKPPNQGVFYRTIKDHWYVFYQTGD